MQIVQGNTLQSLRAVQAFLDAHADLLASVANSGARKKLDAQVEGLSTHVATQSGSGLASKGATQKQRALRLTLLQDHMAPIARIAAADLPHTPELLPLKMPRGTPSTETLFAAATGMADTAERYSAVFIAAGLSQDFIAQLHAAAAALLVPLDARAQSRGSSQGATQGLKAELRSARKTVRVLDALVRRVLKADPALLASWNAVKRPPAKTGKAAAPVTPPSPAPAASHPTLVTA
jgi:hypothetical protein